MTSAIKILEIDIETAPSLVYTWGLRNQNIGVNQIVEPGHMLCWAAKFQHQKTMHWRSAYHDFDYLTKLWSLLDQADAVVHYNGKSFDTKHIQKEFLLHNMLPPSPFHQIDLLQTVRQQFKFISNKLQHIAEQLEIGVKEQTGGMQLWIDCMKEDVQAWKTMRKYNIQDVVLLNKLYHKILPWIKEHPNFALYMNDPKLPTCTNCGSTHGQWRGEEHTAVLSYERWRCNECGHWSRARQNTKTRKPKDTGVLK